MELRQVGYFVAVAGTGSMSRAAVSLAMTQSGLSRQISALESELSVRLFERTGHGVVLTDAGRALLPDARAMLGHADALRSAAERHQGQPKGRVVLAVTPMVAQAITTPVLAAARAVHAGIQVEIMESSGSMVGEWLGQWPRGLSPCRSRRRSSSRARSMASGCSRTGCASCRRRERPPARPWRSTISGRSS
jgi:DNA-binding transcriptional LysR family regulator